MKKYWLILLVGAVSCKDEFDDCVNPVSTGGQIFSCTYLIEIPYYIYFDEFLDGDTTPVPVKVLGDSSYYLFTSPLSADVPVPQNDFSTFSQHFEIHWASTSIKELTVGIFTNPILTNDDSPREILNPQDMVWMWNTGMGEDDGVINYSEGSSVSVEPDGTINFLPQHLLQVGATYYLGMWGYNDEATKVIYSSRQIELKVFD
ncbi:MAG: hypothetical protein ACHQFW_09745 [Chitinophagales bacterium]